MSGPDPGASPQPQGTNPSGGKPEGGNNPPGTNTGDPIAPSPSTEEQKERITSLEAENRVLTKNYSDSSRAEQTARLQLQQSQESDRIRQQQAQEQQNLSQENQTLENVGQRIIKGAYAEDPTEVGAALGDVLAIGREQGRQIAREDTAKFETQRRQTAQAKAQAMPFWTDLLDQSNQTSQRVWELYTQIYSAHSAGQYKSFLPADEENIEGTNININWHLLNEARMMQAVEGGSPPLAPAATGHAPLESSGGGQAIPTRQQLIAGKGGPDLMTEGERADALRMLTRQDGETDEQMQTRYYFNFPDNVKRVREKTGKLVTRSDIAEAASGVT